LGRCGSVEQAIRGCESARQLPGIRGENAQLLPVSKPTGRPRMKTYTTAEVFADFKQRCQEQTQAKLADSFGFNRAFINDVLKGRRNVTVKLAEALGYTKLADRYQMKGKN
jgi:hypothetical protein